jgi:23S rRNA (uracil1939-C5)-methyltransferase
MCKENRNHYYKFSMDLKMNLMVGQEIDLDILRLGINGEGVGYLDGFTFFVEGALPGEKVRARVLEKRRTFGRAELIQHFAISPHRTQAPCPLFGECGGCQLMHLEGKEQLEMKRMRVKDALVRIGKFSDIEVEPCLPSPLPLGYRNKIQLPVQEGYRLGLYARNSHELVVIERCFIHCDLGEKAFQQIKRILKAHPAEVLKHVLIKTAVNTSQVLVILVTISETLLSTLAEQIMQSMPEICGVVQNINPHSGNVVLRGDFHTLAGASSIEEKLLRLSFKVSPASFFQVNPRQAEVLYLKVIEFSELTGKEKVLDAYCGVGTLSLLLAQRAQKVFGLESVEEAIRDARENARNNQIFNVTFDCGKVETLISGLNEIDVAILNPPRKGCEGSFLERLLVLKPQRIIYVSCDPATLARDLEFLCHRGYSLKKVQPVDMFPQTAHVETVVQLECYS